jgi:hypothetical protein
MKSTLMGYRILDGIIGMFLQERLLKLKIITAIIIPRESTAAFVAAWVV